jgi:hypothetical protein
LESVNVPARIRTTHGLLAEQVTAPTFAPSMALWIAAPVIDPVPPGAILLQAAVSQFGHVAEGMSPCTPDNDQLAARLGAMSPDHVWAYPYEEQQSRVKKNTTECLYLIIVPEGCFSYGDAKTQAKVAPRRLPCNVRPSSSDLQSIRESRSLRWATNTSSSRQKLHGLRIDCETGPIGEDERASVH